MSELLHLTDNIYVFPGDLRTVRPWLGVVITPEGTVLIDSGNSPGHAADVQAALDALEAPPVRMILLTHHHWDHVFGSCAFPEATVIAHELTQHHLQVMAGEPWSADYIQQKAGDDPSAQAVAYMMAQAIPDWSTFRAVPAAITFTTTYRLQLGNTHFLLEHVGGVHEPDQCVVHVRPGNVLFIGDLPYGRGSRDTWDTAAIANGLEALLAWDAAYYVEGHRRPADPVALRGRIAKLRAI